MPDVRFRDAIPSDGSDLALLTDAATRRLVSWFWDAATETGQSSFEVGRNIVLSSPSSLSHYTRWRVASVEGRVVGGINSYVLDTAERPDSVQDSSVTTPLVELKELAVGSWYVSVASVFPEARGQGVGRAILNEAEGTGVSSVSLLVASFNPRAMELYERVGFSERSRRAFVPFPGSDAGGDWILMVKEISDPQSDLAALTI